MATQQHEDHLQKGLPSSRFIAQKANPEHTTFTMGRAPCSSLPYVSITAVRLAASPSSGNKAGSARKAGNGTPTRTDEQARRETDRQVCRETERHALHTETYSSAREGTCRLTPNWPYLPTTISNNSPALSAPKRGTTHYTPAPLRQRELSSSMTSYQSQPSLHPNYQVVRSLAPPRAHLPFSVTT
jgi:hypothetical protein